MSLTDAIQEACLCFADPPSNEKNTELHVVYPMLLAMGYERRSDIDGGSRDTVGYFPDYTILPEQPEFTWYIEVKAWLESLDDKGKHQAIDYANRNGKRWVVLTNGRVWRLYDNYVRGVADDKLVMQAQLSGEPSAQNEDMLKFLTILSKNHVLSGGLEHSIAQYQQQQQAQTEAATRQEIEARERREREATAREALNGVLLALLQDQASDLVQQMCLVLQQQNGLEAVTDAMIAEWFHGCYVMPPAVMEPRLPALTRPAQSNMIGGKNTTLQELAQTPIDGKQRQPTLLTLPDDSSIRVGSWVDMAKQAVTWVYEQGKRPQIPFAGYNMHRWFLNTSPHHPHSPMRQPKTIAVGTYIVYMDRDMSAEHFTGRLVALCLATGIDPSTIRVSLN